MEAISVSIERKCENVTSTKEFIYINGSNARYFISTFYRLFYFIRYLPLAKKYYLCPVLRMFAIQSMLTFCTVSTRLMVIIVDYCTFVQIETVVVFRFSRSIVDHDLGNQFDNSESS